MAALPGMLEGDRRRAGWTIEEAAWHLGLTQAFSGELEAGTRSPTRKTWERICKLFGWGQTFVA